MSNQMIVIGITGVARSGKDTIARILCSRFGFTRIALADGVRSAFRDLDGPTWELTKNLEAAGKTARWALQTLGTECRVDTGSGDLWNRLLLTKIAYLRRYHPVPVSRLVISDLRFASECQFFRAAIPYNFGNPFHVWKVVRAEGGLQGDAAKHPSEIEVERIDPDVSIFNDNTLAELEMVVSQYARQLLEDQ